MNEILLHVEAFRDDILYAIKEKGSKVWVVEDNDVSISIHWTCPHIKDGQEIVRKFDTRACNLIDQVKAYLFDITVCMINL